MHTKAIYITVRLDLESDSPIGGDTVQDVVSELDYNFSSRTDGVAVSGTEICGTADEADGG